MKDYNMVVVDKGLNLSDVRAFVSVADLRSFTRAADTLRTTQSVISLRIKRLEKQLNNRLLERTPRAIRLTPCGASFLVAARDLLKAHEKALALDEEIE